MWDVSTAKREGTLYEKGFVAGPGCCTGPFHFLQAHRLLFTSDGKRLISVGGDFERGFTVWDAETGKVILMRKGVENARASPDGRVVALETKEGVVLWNVGTQQAVAVPQNGALGDFSPDGRHLVIAKPEALLLVAVLGGPPVTIASGSKRMDLWGWRFSPDSRLLAIAWGDGSTTTWNVSDGKPAGPPLPADRVFTYRPSPFGHEHRFRYSTTFSSDSRLLAIVREEVELWGVATGQLATGQSVGRTFGRNTTALSLLFSPTAPLLAVSISGYPRVFAKEVGNLDIFDVGALPPQAVEHLQKALPIAFSPDGATLAYIVQPVGLALWSSRQHRATLLGGCQSDDLYTPQPTFSPDGTWIACHGSHMQDVTLWNVSEYR